MKRFQVQRALGLALVPMMMAALPVFAADQVHTHTQTRHQETMTTTQQSMPSAQMQQHQQRTAQSSTTMQPGQTGAMATEIQFARDAQGQLARGEWLLVEKNYPEAISAFQQVLSSNSNHPRALEGLAQAYMMSGQYDQAERYIDQAITFDPANTRLFLEQARIFDAQNEQAKALESYLTFLALNPTDSARVEAARRAEELYTQWQPQLNEAQRAYFNGLRNVAFGNPQQGIIVLRQYVTANPTINDQWLNAQRVLGVAYLQANRPTEAIATWEAITKQQPQNPVGYYHLSTSYDQVGRPQNAQDAWNSFLRYAPNSQATMPYGQPGVMRQQRSTTPGTPTTTPARR